MSEERAVVFVVDDDPSIRRSLDSLLRSVGHDVRLFSSAQEFMGVERPDAPGCLVLDVRLPGMSGLEFQTTGEKTRRRFEGTLNGGGASVKLETTNGGVRLSKSTT